MMKIAIVFTAVFCINSVVWAQDTQELKYFKSDNAFYLGSNRLSDNEIERTLSSNVSALDAWKRGNSIKTANTAMKITTWSCLGVGGGLLIVPLTLLAIFDVDIFYEIPSYIGLGLLSMGLITAITIPITKASYKSNYSKAAGIYNNGLNTVSLHIGTTGNGIGFSLNF